MPPIPKPLPRSPRAALAHLAAIDPAIARALDAGVRFTLPERQPTLHMLCRSVIGQSISMQAAQRIVERFTARFGDDDALDPAALVAADVEEVRGLGLTMGKAAAMQSLARVWAEQRWTSQGVRSVGDEELLARLRALRGIGPWTVKMFLIFGLRRPDVMPHEDLGVREGVRLLDRAADRPTPRATIERTQCWAPWRTVGTVLAWQAVMHARGGDMAGGEGWW